RFQTVQLSSVMATNFTSWIADRRELHSRWPAETSAARWCLAGASHRGARTSIYDHALRDATRPLSRVPICNRLPGCFFFFQHVRGLQTGVLARARALNLRVSWT